MVETLKVSLYRKQYKNILESIKNATNFSHGNSPEIRKPKAKSAIVTNTNASDMNRLSSTIKFSVPVFEINLQNECYEPLVNMTFKDFGVEHCISGNNEYLKVLLNSVLMEDLKSDISSPFRNMVTSINLEKAFHKKGQTSSSCPDLPNFTSKQPRSMSSSEPANLCEYTKIKNNKKYSKHSLCNSKDFSYLKKHNLVIYKSHTRRVIHSSSEAKSETENSIEFNCLNLTMCVDRWYTIFDFFGLISDTEETGHAARSQKDVDQSMFFIRIKLLRVIVGKQLNLFGFPGASEFSSRLDVSIRSLNFNLTRSDILLSKINISNATFSIIQEASLKAVEGCLGSISVYDLTKFGYLYKERFFTSGKEALNFVYKR